MTIDDTLKARDEGKTVAEQVLVAIYYDEEDKTDDEEK